MAFRYQAVCQWCGRTGSIVMQPKDAPPTTAATVSGTCKAHPSGKPNMPHGPRWEKR